MPKIRIFILVVFLFSVFPWSHKHGGFSWSLKQGIPRKGCVLEPRCRTDQQSALIQMIQPAIWRLPDSLQRQRWRSVALCQKTVHHERWFAAKASRHPFCSALIPTEHEKPWIEVGLSWNFPPGFHLEGADSNAVTRLSYFSFCEYRSHFR